MLDIRPGRLIPTAKGLMEVVGLRFYKGRVRFQFLDGDEAVELSAAELLSRALPREVPGAAPPPSDNAWLFWLSSDERHLVERGIEDLHDILYPTHYDPDAWLPDGADANRYADHIDQAERVRRKVVDSAKRHEREGKRWTRSTLYRYLDAYRSERGRCFVHGNRVLDIDVAEQTDPDVFKTVVDYYQRTLAGPKRHQQIHYLRVLEALGSAASESDDASTTPPSAEAAKAPEERLPLARFAALWRVLEKGAPVGHSAKLRASQAKRPEDTRTKHLARELGDLIEADATPCDFEVRGENGPFKPHAVFAIDVATRYLWLRLTPGPPTSLDYRLLFFDVICGYEWVPVDSDLATITVHPRAIRVLPGCVVLDHGKEGENEQVLGLLAALHIDVLWARTRTPTDKPHVESMIRHFASAEQLLSAYKGNSPANSGEAPQVSALPTFEAARLMFKGFSRWYADQPHNGLRHGLVDRRLLTPNEAVGASLIRNGHRLADDPNVVFAFLPVMNVTPQADGVSIAGVRYAPAAGYTEIWRQSYKSGNGRRTLPFHYDPSDGRWIFYNLPGTYEWIPLYRPGGDDAAVVPFDDIRSEVLESILGHRRPSNKERRNALARLQHEVIDPVEAVDRQRKPTPSRPHVIGGKPTASIDNSPSWLERVTGIDPNALADFDITADDFGYEE